MLLVVNSRTARGVLIICLCVCLCMSTYAACMYCSFCVSVMYLHVYNTIQYSFIKIVVRTLRRWHIERMYDKIRIEMYKTKVWWNKITNKCLWITFYSESCCYHFWDIVSGHGVFAMRWLQHDGQMQVVLARLPVKLVEHEYKSFVGRWVANYTAVCTTSISINVLKVCVCLLPSPLLSERRRYCVARRLCVCLCLPSRDCMPRQSRWQR